jgi:hypothetical protein
MSNINILSQFKSKLKDMPIEEIEATKAKLEEVYMEVQAKELAVLAGIMECEKAIAKWNKKSVEKVQK